MDRASARTAVVPPIEAGMLAAAVKDAIREADRHDEPATAIDAAVGALHSAVGSLYPSVFLLEHGRLWLVAQRGYAVVPDGIGVGHGVMGRAVRRGRAELVRDVRADSEYLEGLPGILSEAAVPLRVGDEVVGAINLEADRVLPDSAPDALEPLALALAPRAEALRAATVLDLSALARLFVYLGSLRDPEEIAALAAASLARVLRVGATQVWMWGEFDTPVELASWQLEGAPRSGPLSGEELDLVRSLVDPTVVCQRLPGRLGDSRRQDSSLVWLPLRTNGKEIGALLGAGGAADEVAPSQLDTAAVLAAHVAASLDAALALRRERLSAVTDPLTEVLNRRGLEERLEEEVSSAQERRVPLSILVLDCDDFKEINDRAGHEFGDALLREIADLLTKSLPSGAEVGRLGGDEFVIVFPGAGADEAEQVGGRIRRMLAEGLTDAGFPLRISAGISTYPFDGATPTSLLRTADQALYAAKSAGKDRIASFGRILGKHPRRPVPDGVATADERRRDARRDVSVLGDALAAVRTFEEEDTVDGLLGRLCKALVFTVGATGCSASRVAGGYLVDAAEHSLREVWLGHEAAYRISDFPLTAETLRSGEPRSVSFVDGEVDAAEAFILRELGMNAMLMVPLRVRGRPWGLLELYEMRLRTFTEDDVSLAQFLTSQAERRLELLASVESPRPRPPVYELPTGSDDALRPRSR